MRNQKWYMLGRMITFQRQSQKPDALEAKSTDRFDWTRTAAENVEKQKG
jgi:hypothetical protein